MADDAVALARNAIRAADQDISAQSGRPVPTVWCFDEDGNILRIRATHVQTLALAILAREAQTCGTCRHQDTSHVDMSGKLSCLRLGRLVPATWHCADHQPKGEQP